MFVYAADIFIDILNPKLKTEYRHETQYQKPGLIIESFSFVDTIFFVKKYYVMWFLYILFCFMIS